MSKVNSFDICALCVTVYVCVFVNMSMYFKCQHMAHIHYLPQCLYLLLPIPSVVPCCYCYCRPWRRGVVATDIYQSNIVFSLNIFPIFLSTFSLYSVDLTKVKKFLQQQKILPNVKLATKTISKIVAILDKKSINYKDKQIRKAIKNC